LIRSALPGTGEELLQQHSTISDSESKRTFEKSQLTYCRSMKGRPLSGGCREKTLNNHTNVDALPGDSVLIEGIADHRLINVLPPSMRCRLEKLYRIAEWIVEDDLRSSHAGNDFVTESESGSAKAFDFFRKISNGYLDSIPSAWTRLTTVRHWASS